jgi:zinc transport system substrate-binding protein
VLSLAALAAPAGAQSPVIDVWVSILPQVEMVERIGGELVSVRVLVQAGHSPATYEPTPRQLTSLWEADLLLRIGAPFESRLVDTIRRMPSRVRIVDTTRGIELQPLEDHGHSHGASLDPHTWLDPVLVAIQAENIAQALCEAEPVHCPAVQANLAAYLEQLDLVHSRVAAIMKPAEGRDLLVFHPSFGYFARRYGLIQVAVEAEGKTPSPRRLARLVDAARSSGATAVYVQPQFTASAAQAVADAVGCDLVQLDPLAPDHLANLQRMAETIAANYED